MSESSKTNSSLGPNKQDHYDVLCLSRDATETDVKQAYRKLALKWHPDKNPENKKDAAECFIKIGEAYSILSDKNKRANYDLGIDIPNETNGKSEWTESFKDSIFKMFEDLFRKYFHDESFDDESKEEEEIFEVDWENTNENGNRNNFKKSWYSRDTNNYRGRKFDYNGGVEDYGNNYYNKKGWKNKRAWNKKNNRGYYNDGYGDGYEYNDDYENGYGYDDGYGYNDGYDGYGYDDGYGYNNRYQRNEYRNGYGYNKYRYNGYKDGYGYGGYKGGYGGYKGGYGGYKGGYGGYKGGYGGYKGGYGYGGGYKYRY